MKSRLSLGSDWLISTIFQAAVPRRVRYDKNETELHTVFEPHFSRETRTLQASSFPSPFELLVQDWVRHVYNIQSCRTRVAQRNFILDGVVSRCAMDPVRIDEQGG